MTYDGEDLALVAETAGLSVDEVVALHSGAEYRVDFLPKTKVELAVDDSVCEQVVEAIANVARTGKVGDGKIFVLGLPQVLRVRTGETGPDAI